jgi:hypothetical protein
MDHVFDVEIVKAIHWCRLGRVRPDDDYAFYRAKQLGLLAQDSIWRATAQGEGVLIALGLLEGKPTPRRTLITVLWAASDDFPPQFVASWSGELNDMMTGEAARQREEAEEWFNVHSPIDQVHWRFWTTTQYIDVPDEPRSPRGSPQGATNE